MEAWAKDSVTFFVGMLTATMTPDQIRAVVEAAIQEAAEVREMLAANGGIQLAPEDFPKPE